jgi:hypothetical protein
VATGIVFGVTAALTEHTGHVLDGGVIHALMNWAPYALAVVSVVGMLLNQSAYQAGDLRWSLPLFTVLEPIIAIVIGLFLFDEHISVAPGARVGEVLGLITMVVGVFWLTNAVTGSPPATPPPTEGKSAPATASSLSGGSIAATPSVNEPSINEPAVNRAASRWGPGQPP